MQQTPIYSFPPGVIDELENDSTNNKTDHAN